MNDDQTHDPPRNPFPNAARRAGAKLEPIATAGEQFDRLALAKPIAKLTAAVDAIPPPTRTIAVGESIRPKIGDELGPTTSLDTEVRDMTDDLLRRAAHRRVSLELDDAVATQRRLTELVRELRARDMSIVGAVVRTLRKRLRGDR